MICIGVHPEPLQNIFYWDIFAAEINLIFMPAKRINQLIKDLSFEKKLLGAGSVLLALSVFFPWYQDVDSFKTGDIFLGLTGPLYLAGYSMLALAVINISLIFAGEVGKKLPFLNVKPPSFFLASGLITFYLLIIINSVYFHNKFGINITMKESQFGMFLAFISASLITIGGYMSLRERSSILKDFEENTQEPFIKIPDPADNRKPKENLRNISQQNVQAEKPQTQIKMDEAPAYAKEEAVIPATEDRKNYQSFRTDL
jgi:hypothetical protein